MDIQLSCLFWRKNAKFITVNERFESRIYLLRQRTFSIHITRNYLHISGIYLVFILATAVWPEEIAMNTWTIVPAALITFLIALWLLPRVYLLAHLVLQFGMAGSITLAIYLFQKPEIAYFYALLPMLSVVCLGWRTGSIMELIIIMLVYWLNHGLVTTPPSLIFNIVICIGGAISGLLGWASMQAVLTVTRMGALQLQAGRKPPQRRARSPRTACPRGKRTGFSQYPSRAAQQYAGRRSGRRRRSQRRAQPLCAGDQP